MTSIEKALQIEHVRRAFLVAGKRLSVLEDISFALDAGTWTTLLGPSGCGKTTLLKILAGLDNPDTGTVRVFGSTGDRRRASAYLPQADTLLPWRTALENAVLASEIAGEPMSDARSEARELFDHFGMSGFEALYPSQLSGGMRQRLSLIRTFLARRDILLLDEPLGALDPLTRTVLQNWLLEVWKELRKTVLLVTHDIEEALVLSDRLLVCSPLPGHIDVDRPVALARPRNRAASELAQQKAGLLNQLLGGDHR